MAGKSKSNNKKRAVKGSMRMKRRGSKVMRGGETTGEWGSAVYGGSNSQHALPGSNVIQMNNPYAAVVGQAGGNKCNMRGGDEAGKGEGKGLFGNVISTVSEGVSNVFGQQPSIEELKAEHDQVLKDRDGFTEGSDKWTALDETQAKLAGEIKDMEEAAAPAEEAAAPVAEEAAAAPAEEVKVPAPASEEGAPMEVDGGSRKRRSAKGGKSPKKGKSAKKMRNKRR